MNPLYFLTETALATTESSAVSLNIAMVLLVIGLPALIALCLAEYFLAKATNPSVGWILPILSGVLGLILPLRELTFQEPVGEILLWFLLPQIPTLLFLLLLGTARHAKSNTSAPAVSSSKEIKKMNIQDL